MTHRPEDPPVRPVESGTMTVEEVSKVEKYTRELNQYLQDQEAWDALKGDFTKKSCMITIKL